MGSVMNIVGLGRQRGRSSDRERVTARQVFRFVNVASAAKLGQNSRLRRVCYSGQYKCSTTRRDLMAGRCLNDAYTNGLGNSGNAVVCTICWREEINADRL